MRDLPGRPRPLDICLFRPPLSRAFTLLDLHLCVFSIIIGNSPPSMIFSSPRNLNAATATHVRVSLTALVGAHVLERKHQLFVQSLEFSYVQFQNNAQCHLRSMRPTLGVTLLLVYQYYGIASSESLKFRSSTYVLEPTARIIHIMLEGVILALCQKISTLHRR